MLLVLLLTSAGLHSVFGQRRVPEARSDTRSFRRCDIEKPLTFLEDFDFRLQTIIVRGSTHVASLPGRAGSVRVDAIELRDESNATRGLGLSLTLRSPREDSTQPPYESQSYIDYEEIDRVVKAWDRIARTDDTITKLNNFESRYRTAGDFEIVVFRQTPGGAIAASVAAGSCERVRIFLSLDELIKLRHMLVEGKQRLDEIK
jgi:hypothetical protein